MKLKGNCLKETILIQDRLYGLRFRYLNMPAFVSIYNLILENPNNEQAYLDFLDSMMLWNEYQQWKLEYEDILNGQINTTDVDTNEEMEI